MRFLKQILVIFAVITIASNAQQKHSELDVVNQRIHEVEQRLEAISYLKNYASLNGIAELSNSDVE